MHTDTNILADGSNSRCMYKLYRYTIAMDLHSDDTDRNRALVVVRHESHQSAGIWKYFIFGDIRSQVILMQMNRTASFDDIDCVWNTASLVISESIYRQTSYAGYGTKIHWQKLANCEALHAIESFCPCHLMNEDFSLNEFLEISNFAMWWCEKNMEKIYEKYDRKNVNLSFNLSLRILTVSNKRLLFSSSHTKIIIFYS